MEFKELFERYKNGTASPEEQELVEAEIEKSRLIDEYLAENFDIPLEQETELDELKRVKKSLRKRSLKLALASIAAAVVIAILTGYFVIPWAREVENGRYLDPRKAEYDDYCTDLDLSLAAYTELHHPGYIYSSTTAENTRIGEYKLTLSRYNWMVNNNIEFMTAALDKGKLELPQEFLYSTLPVNAIARATYPVYTDFAEEDVVRELKERLKELPGYICVTAAVSFGEDMTMEELCGFMEESGVQFIWAGIRNAPEDEQRVPLCGMELTGSGPVYDDVNEDYPAFELAVTDFAAEDYRQHFISLLEYTIDHPEFIDAFICEGYAGAYYGSVLDYVTENGVMCYGGVVRGTGEDLLELFDMDEVMQLYIMDAELSF